MADELERYMLSLRVAQISAVVESARISSQGDFLDIFVSIKEQIEKTHDELAELSEALHGLDRLAHDTPPVAHSIETTVQRIDADIRALPDLTDDAAPPPPPSGRMQPAVRRVTIAPHPRARVEPRQPACR
jgi:hypothetical protein